MVRLMKIPIYPTLLLLFASFTLSNAADATARKSPFDGTWRWEFAMPDGGTVSPTIKFKFKEGQLSGTSRFRAGTETPLTNIFVQGNQISFNVLREYLGESVLTHYRGTLMGDTIKGKIASKSNGEVALYEWEAHRANGIDGTWKWSVTFGERTIDSRVSLKQEGDKLRGKMSLGRGEVDIHRGRFRNNNVFFEVERRGFDGEKSTNVFRGKFSGDKITGTYVSATRGTNEWNAVRAD